MKKPSKPKTVDSERYAKGGPSSSKAPSKPGKALMPKKSGRGK